MRNHNKNDARSPRRPTGAAEPSRCRSDSERPVRHTRGMRSGEPSAAVFDPNRRRRRIAGGAVLAVLLLAPLIVAQAAFGFPLKGGLLPGFGQENAPHAAQGSSAKGDPKPHSGGRGGVRAKEPKAPGDARASVLPPAPDDPTLRLTVPRLGIEGDTVKNDESEEALGKGAIKLPQTGFPWEKGANTYVACHRIGFPGTESHNQCLDLGEMKKGDEIRVKDANGATYRYRATEFLTVLPHETWVADPVEGKQLLSLQTCIEAPGDFATLGPDWGARYVVRAELVASKAAASKG